MSVSFSAGIKADDPQNESAGNPKIEIIKDIWNSYIPLDMLFGTRIAEAIYTLRHWGKD